MASCSCGAEIAYVYIDGDELHTIDAGRAPAGTGNLVLDGRVSGHFVTPGTGTHRSHRCPSSTDRDPEPEEALA